MAKTVAERGRDFTARAKAEGRRIIKVALTKKATEKLAVLEAQGQTATAAVNKLLERSR